MATAYLFTGDPARPQELQVTMHFFDTDSYQWVAHYKNICLDSTYHTPLIFTNYTVFTGNYSYNCSCVSCDATAITAGIVNRVLIAFNGDRSFCNLESHPHAAIDTLQRPWFRRNPAQTHAVVPFPILPTIHSLAVVNRVVAQDLYTCEYTAIAKCK